MDCKSVKNPFPGDQTGLADFLSGKDLEVAEQEAHFEALVVIGKATGPISDKRELDDAF